MRYKVALVLAGLVVLGVNAALLVLALQVDDPVVPTYAQDR